MRGNLHLESAKSSAINDYRDTASKSRITLDPQLDMELAPPRLRSTLSR